jgi:PAT family beta-lactamase induction signal transducer AmpG
MSHAASGLGKGPRHPIVYTILIVPFGATSGFVTVALAYLATKRGLSVEQGASLVALSLLPQVWKFFWSPIADTTLTRKRWYVIANAVVALSLFALATLPLGSATLGLIHGLVFLASFASTFVGFAVEAFIAHLTPESDRGRVSGWYQAGNLGGTGLGGGLGLWLLQALPSPWQTGLILAAVMLACNFALRFLPDVPAESRGASIGVAMRNLGADLWSVMWSRTGFLCVVLCIIPVGTGAASSVLAQAEIAAHWGAGANAVELVQGFLAGLISMAGCIVGGYGCNRWGSRAAYVGYGLIMAGVAVAMAFLPATLPVYIAGSLAYSFTTGLTYAAFTGFVLDAIGAGNAATKYNGFASISNTPIWYMGLVLAFVDTRFGHRNMLLTEAACAVVGVLIFAIAANVGRRRAEGRN